MFVGHLAAAFIAKRAKPEVHLAWFVSAVSLVDLIWPILLLVGVERVQVAPGNTAFTPLAFEHYPWTHSLAMGALWGLLFAGLARWRGISRGSAALLAALVLSHWVLDLLTHRSDLPLWPGGGPLLGLGLWNSIPGTLIIEGLLWLLAIAAWFASQRPRSRSGWAAVLSFIIVSTLLWVSGPFAPAPARAQDIAVGAMLGWIIVPWAFWIERGSGLRESRR